MPLCGRARNGRGRRGNFRSLRHADVLDMCLGGLRWGIGLLRRCPETKEGRLHCLSDLGAWLALAVL
eukprot:874040-Alexandrium_andersonii.AAC.1